MFPKGKIPETWLTKSTPVERIKGERTGWKPQKFLSLYERIIKVSSNKRTIVPDLFAGCAATCAAAEILERQWIGIDCRSLTEKVTKERLYNVSGIAQQIDIQFVHVKKYPSKRTDIRRVNNDQIRLTLCKKQGAGV